MLRYVWDCGSGGDSKYFSPPLNEKKTMRKKKGIKNKWKEDTKKENQRKKEKSEEKKSKKERKGKKKRAKTCTLGRALDLDAPRLRLGSPGFSTGKQIEREKMR